jgi:leucyl/phenylalanyl-tRNA--protein transferase
MPVYQLPGEIAFPDPSEAEADGLLAVGGDLSPERVLAAYSIGIFPWPHARYPLMWFSPDPRYVLFPDELKLARSLKQTIKKQRFEVRYDTDFAGVIAGCSRIKRKGQRGTWITKPMVAAYTVSLGAAFFGESMFATEDDASKVAFAALVAKLKDWGFHFIDAQVHTPHLERFGTRPIPRADYLDRLAKALCEPTRRGSWG